jgi:hypothetical protein
LEFCQQQELAEQSRLNTSCSLVVLAVADLQMVLVVVVEPVACYQTLVQQNLPSTVAQL